MSTKREYDEDMVLPQPEEVLMNEDEMLKGLLSAAKEIAETEKTVQIVRNGKTYFSFRVRPVTDEDIQECVKYHTKYYTNPNGKKLPKIEGETNWAAYKCRKIYIATVDADKAKLWDNPAIKNGLGAFTPEDVIQSALLPGERQRISDIIDELSGYNDDEVSLEEYAKN